MVNEQEQNSGRRPSKQGVRDVIPEPNKINASTPYDFNGKNLTPYGGLLPVITMLKKLGFQSLVEQTVTSKRIPRAMDLYGFVLGIVLGLYIGLVRLNQLRFIARAPILTLGAIHLLVVLPFITSMGFGQEVRGIISKLVTDPQGAVLVGTRVEVKGLDTNVL